MTYQPDLSRYDYFPETVPAGVRALNVGWLDSDHEFPRGEVSEDFLDGLFVACRDHRAAVTRGLYRCPFCKTSDRPTEYPPPPATATRGKETVVLGNAEVRFLGDDPSTWLIAPTLAFHYIEAHGYRPPDVFIDAVVAQRFAPSG
ncbi:MAG: hypothetical protein M3340_04105 [Actinomycetota bacterium]|nr:hypothetical protein [Actinomycetota bacterium]